MISEQCYRNALEAMGFASGISNTCLFHHAERVITVVVHGEDFTATATDVDLDWYTLELDKVAEIKVRGRLGEGCLPLAPVLYHISSSSLSGTSHLP